MYLVTQSNLFYCESFLTGSCALIWRALRRHLEFQTAAGPASCRSPEHLAYLPAQVSLCWRAAGQERLYVGRLLVRHGGVSASVYGR